MKDLESEVATLRARGVVFEDYDTPQLKTASAIFAVEASKAATWFEASEGNIMPIIQSLGE